MYRPNFSLWKVFIGSDYIFDIYQLSQNQGGYYHKYNWHHS